MTYRPWSHRQGSLLTWFCDRCRNVFQPLTIQCTVCPDCAHSFRMMSSAEVLAAATKAQATKPHHKPARRRAS